LYSLGSVISFSWSQLAQLTLIALRRAQIRREPQPAGGSSADLRQR